MKHKSASRPVQTAAAKGQPCDVATAVAAPALLAYANDLPAVPGTGMPDIQNPGGTGIPALPGTPIRGGFGTTGGMTPAPGGLPFAPGAPADPVEPADPQPAGTTDPQTPDPVTVPTVPTPTPTTGVGPTDPVTPDPVIVPTVPSTPTPGTGVDPTDPTPVPTIPTVPETPIGGGDPDPVHGAVPEPGTWLMMIAGFGFVGLGLRWRRARAAAPSGPVAGTSFRRRRRPAKAAKGMSALMASLGIGEVATGSASMATIAAKTMLCVCPTAAMIGATMASPPLRTAVYKATAVPAPQLALAPIKPPCDPTLRSADASSPSRIIDASEASPRVATALLASTSTDGTN